MPTHTAVRPLLKWAGGKRQLLPALAAHYPSEFRRYVEPFVGSGAVFFHLAALGALDGKAVRLCDVNPDLIGCYVALRDHPDAVIAHLGELEREHRAGGDACYYEVRDSRFNPQRSAWFAADRDPAAAALAYPTELAAMLIFLNRTGFNGLYRMNRRGEFNVPAGRYTEPRICDPDHLRHVSAIFRRRDLSIEYRSFDATLEGTGAGDFVYCDPPYAPLSRTSNFAHYTKEGFSAFDQRRLQQAVVAASRRGARVVVSNSSAPEIVAAYGSREARAAGLVMARVPARRAINAQAASRGPVDELIISNVARESLHAVRPRMLKAEAPARRVRQAPASQTRVRQLGHANARRRSATNET